MPDQWKRDYQRLRSKNEIASTVDSAVMVLLLPMQTEQFLMSRCVGRTGGGINAAEWRRPVDWRARLRQMLGQPSFRDAARAFAQAHAGFTQQGLVSQLVDAFEANLP